MGLETNINTINIKPRVGRDGEVRNLSQSPQEEESSDLRTLPFLWAEAFLNLCLGLKVLSRREERLTCSTGFPGLDWGYGSASYHAIPSSSLSLSLSCCLSRFLSLLLFLILSTFLTLFLSFLPWQCCQSCPRHTAIPVNSV